ncbi:MAG: hypothetical protein HOL15_09480 [Nitrospinaceae bacterium]|nr:hypothetical protein [Nitrospina sp.]MBT5377031.1 hypothetical protein [Nitrospinaceae bacterium]MBT5869801.1 hypothetical protein [Nitrospinaceae bacterium]
MNATLETDNNIATDDYFLLAILKWDDKSNDYLPVNDPSTVTQTFTEFSDAENAYFSTDYASCSNSQGKDIKIELIHMRFGSAHIVRNQILFP